MRVCESHGKHSRSTGVSPSRANTTVGCNLVYNHSLAAKQITYNFKIVDRLFMR